MKKRLFAPGLLALSVLLSACGGAVTPTPMPGAPTPVPGTPAPTMQPGGGNITVPGLDGEQGGDLSGIKAYLLERLGVLKTSTAAFSASANEFYELAKGSNFDYAGIWSSKKAEVTATVEKARNHWLTASPTYEQVEGIVAGVPSLAEYDVILDAGASGAEGPDGAVPFDLTLPDGKVLPKPGNLFGVNESALWGTYDEYTADVKVDYDGNGTTDFGDAMPDANVLKAAAEALDKNTADLVASAQDWSPTSSDAFTSLVVMVPTMSEYFNSWKNSRFVTGEESEQRDFVAISRLADIVGIIGGLQVVYGELSPTVAKADSEADKQIRTELDELKEFVQGVLDQEQGGKKFTPEEADLLGEDAQNRATAIAGQISQVAAKLGIEIEE